MKVLKVIMKQCDLVRSLEPRGYLGIRLGGCLKLIEHMLLTKSGIERVRVPCDSCVLAKLYRSSFVVGQPVVSPQGWISFLVKDDRQARRVLREHSDSLVSVEELDYRDVVLTPRQMEALKLLAHNGAGASKIARALGVTKPAAHKLAKRSLEKLAKIHAM